MNRVFFSLLVVALACQAPLARSQTYSESVVYKFCTVYDQYCNDGQTPLAALVQGSDGSFYGTTNSGGVNNDGTAFHLSLAGNFTTLYNFCNQGGASCTDGSLVDAGYAVLVEGSDGNFYGTTPSGGAYNSGSVFKITPSGVRTTIYSFCAQGEPYCADGWLPFAGLVLGSDGNFYGSTYYGGASTVFEYGTGTIFKITPSGTLTTLYNFCKVANAQGGCDDGDFPQASMVQGSDGNFYGSTYAGGTYSRGTIFRMTPSGTLTTIYTFTGETDGEDPAYALVEGSDGNFYGTTQLSENSVHQGAFFKISASGAMTTLYNFCALANCTDGEDPEGSLALGTDGNFYGTAEEGGPLGYGTVFQITPSGVPTILYNFCGQSGCADGANPETGLAQGSDGNFYGTTNFGGNGNQLCHEDTCGTIFKLAVSPALAAPVQVALSSSTIDLGAPVTLNWQVLNAFSTTLRQCYAYESLNGVTTALGKLTGTYNSSTKLYSGSVSFTPSAAGTYNFALTCGGMESGSATLTAVGANSNTVVTASPNPITIGLGTLLSATVTGAGATPTGSVTFLYGSTVLKVATLSSGVATDTVDASVLETIPAGKYSITAHYSGDANYAVSNSPTYIVTLNSAPTSTALTASSSTVTPPANETFTAMVKRSASGAIGTPTGQVTFSTGTIVLGTVNLNSSGVAELTQSTSGAPAGTYPVTAKYSGDSKDAASSGTTTITVK